MIINTLKKSIITILNTVNKYLVRPVDLHLAVEAVVEQEVVRHAYAVRLHRVTLAIVVVPDVTCDELMG